MSSSEQINESKPVSDFVQARQLMAKVFDGDPDFFDVYVANVAMLLHDRHGITEHEARNKAAKDILRLIFWDKR